MTTATTNLALGKPVVGADSDAWGGELNTIFDTLDSHLAGVLYGLTLSAAGGTGTFGIATGAASGMMLASAYTKTTGAWAVGSGNGALDTGAIANSTWYHVFIIERTDTLVVDILFSLSPTAPTMPASYTLKRRIGSMKTDGAAQWVKFVQVGDEFLWAVPVNDLASGTLGTAAVLTTLSVPTGFQVVALLRGDVAHNTINTLVLVSSPDETDAAPGAGNYTAIVQVAAQAIAWGAHLRTNTSGQVRSRSSAASTTIEIVTRGWLDNRGRV